MTSVSSASLGSPDRLRGFDGWSRRVRQLVSRCLTPLAAHAARAYIAGPELADALRVAAELADAGRRITLGYWDGPDDGPRSVADAYLAALDALAVCRPGSYLSIKSPALGASPELIDEVAARAGQQGVPLHFDSLGPDAADAMWSTIERLSGGAAPLSASLPGRWRRSLGDADRAVELGVAVRLVKGQWSDPECATLDMREGFLRVTDRLAGRADRAAVATHDAPLAREAIRRMQAAGTSCELELLYGLPERAALRVAAEHNVPVRFYVPYGRAYLPYCLGQVRRQPRLLWWLLRDSLLAGLAAPRR